MWQDSCQTQRLLVLFSLLESTKIWYKLHLKDLKSLFDLWSAFEVWISSQISSIPRPWFREMLMDQDDLAFISALRAVAAHYRRCAQQQALGPGISWLGQTPSSQNIPKTKQPTRWFNDSSTNLLVVHLGRETLDTSSFRESGPGGVERKPRRRRITPSSIELPGTWNPCEIHLQMPS